MPQSFLLPPLLRDAPVAVASLDARGLIVDANRALLEVSGYSIDELRGHSFFEFLEADGADAVRARFLELTFAPAGTYRVEQRIRARTGDIHDADLSISLVRDDAGRPVGSLAVLQDVTGYKRALREAARRAAEFEAVLQSIPAAVYIGDADGVAIANETGLRELGFGSVAEIRDAAAPVGDRLNVRDAATGEAVPPSNRGFARALRGERVDTELLIRHGQTGDDRVHRVIAAPIMLDGDIVGAVAVTQDITERRATQEALRMSEARYRALVEQSPLSIQILSPGGMTIQVNKAWERLWGVTLEDLAAYNMLEDQQLVERGLMPYIRRAFGGEAVQIPAIMYDPNQTLPDRSAYADPRRWVRAVAYPLKDANGRVREVVLVHEDITEQVKAEEERQRVEAERERLLQEAQRSQSELEAAGRVKDEFLAMLSHELRTPLNAVLGWARILRTRSAPDDMARAAEVIERNAVAQARLIDDLLDLSRIITGKIRLTLDRVDMESVTVAALESVKPAADAKRIEIALAIPANLPAINGDAQRLQQVFWNLLSNAVKFTESGGRVVVAVAADERYVHGEVSDTGIGITPDILPFIFDRFMQADSSSTRAHSGLGLGLAIVKHLVEAHGGTVHAVSGGPGQGATFRFSLPR